MPLATGRATIIVANVVTATEATTATQEQDDNNDNPDPATAEAAAITESTASVHKQSPPPLRSVAYASPYSVIYGVSAEVFMPASTFPVHILTDSSYGKERDYSEVVLLLGNFGNMIDVIQKVQQNVSSIQENLRDKHLTSASGDVLQVVVNGAQEVVAIQLNPQYLQAENKAMLEDLLIACLNDALSQSRLQSQSAMSKLAGEFNLPSIPGLF